LLWLPFVTLHYLMETDDFECLEQVIPFYDESEATLREHCLRALRVAISRRSPRGLPLILDADWNDGMNAVGIGGQGESIWMAHFLYYLLTRWAQLPGIDENIHQSFEREAEALRTATNQYGWDGEWFWRASTDQGDLIGSQHSPEGKIFLNAQTWAVLSGITSPERANRALQSAREQLYQPYGALLLAPAYTIPNPQVGYLTRYAPGLRENGGVYFHAACWAVLAERKLHGPQAAYDLWKTMAPILRGLNPDDYQAEPYVTPGNVDGPLSPYPGRAGWTWYTGSGQWLLRVMVEGVLGIEAHLNGLRVSPGLPAEWTEFSVQRPFRGAVYRITVRRAQTGEQPGCQVNGQPWQGEFLPLAGSGQTMTAVFIV
jgi:cellobiose phosphorylase